MTEAMPFLQKAILLSYDPWPFCPGAFFPAKNFLRSRNFFVPPPSKEAKSREQAASHEFGKDESL